jgi:hypothetical protein
MVSNKNRVYMKLALICLLHFASNMNQKTKTLQIHCPPELKATHLRAEYKSAYLWETMKEMISL